MDSVTFHDRASDFDRWTGHRSRVELASVRPREWMDRAWASSILPQEQGLPGWLTMNLGSLSEWMHPRL